MAEGATYDIPEVRWTWFKDKMDTLRAKVRKLTTDDLYVTVVGKHRQEGGSLDGKMMLEVFVAAPDVKLDGWTFVARLEHNPKENNLVYVMPGQKMPERFRYTGPTCVHCGINRKRNNTFVIRKGDQVAQVGSSCLKDFTGHPSPAKWIQLANTLALVPEIVKSAKTGKMPDENEDFIRNHRFYNLEEYLDWVSHCVNSKGWVSVQMSKDSYRTATSWDARDLMLSGDRQRITDEDRALTQEALAEVLKLGDADEITDYEHNILTLAQTPFIENKHFGMAASIVGYALRQGLMRNQANKSALGSLSEFVGEIGESVELHVTVTDFRRTEFSNMVTMVTPDDSVIIWFASTDLLQDDVGKLLTIKAKVKKHNLWNNVRQTVVSHVRKV